MSGQPPRLVATIPDSNARGREIMTTSEFVSSVATVLAIMAVIAGMELIVPLFPRTAEHRGRISANLGLTAVAFALNWAFTSAAAVASIVAGPGLLAATGLSRPLQGLAS